MPIVLGNIEDMPVLDSGTDLVAGWAANNLATFRENSQFTAGAGAAQGNKTLWTATTGKHQGKLRIDRQRIIGVNPRNKEITQYVGRQKGKKHKNDPTITVLDPSGYPEHKFIEVTKEVTVFDYVWTLFAAQVDKTHNQVFVLNNHNMINAVGAARFEDIWKVTLQHGGGAVLTSNENRLPEGFTMMKTIADDEGAIQYW